MSGKRNMEKFMIAALEERAGVDSHADEMRCPLGVHSGGFCAWHVNSESKRTKEDKRLPVAFKSHG